MIRIATTPLTSGLLGVGRQREATASAPEMSPQKSALRDDERGERASLGEQDKKAKQKQKRHSKQSIERPEPTAKNSRLAQVLRLN